MPNTLFRREVSEHQKVRLMGAISLAQPLSIYVWLFTLLTLFVLVGAFLLLSEHHRKERVRGYLLPDKGLLRIHGTSSATVVAIHIREGDEVASGDLLLSLDRDQFALDGAGLGSRVIERLEQRLQLLRETIADHEQLTAERQASYQTRLGRLDLQVEQMSQQLAFARARLRLQEKRLATQRELHNRGHLSDLHMDQGEAAFLSEQLSLGELEHQVLAVRERREQIAEESTQLPIQSSIRANELQRQASELAQRRDEIMASFQSSILASEPGIVTGVEVVPGELIEPGDPLLTLIPVDSRLVAELLLPTRSVGQIKVGDPARLRFDAFPYQQFGIVTAEILQIDRVLKRPGGKDPVITREPVYRVRAGLAAQQIDEHPLRAGMLVEADILLEKRRLLDWLLAPLVGFRERLG